MVERLPLGLPQHLIFLAQLDNDISTSIMRMQLTGIENAKTGLHVAQSFFIFVTACLDIAILTRSGYTGGRAGYNLCLVSAVT